jgi:hypothetical protein
VWWHCSICLGLAARFFKNFDTNEIFSIRIETGKSASPRYILEFLGLEADPAPEIC